MFYFRTDANDRIASGHVMRCLTIAKELLSKGYPCTFLLSDNAGINIIENAGLPFVKLKTASTDYDSCADEINSLKILNENSVLITDSYDATAAYFEKLNTKVAYLGSKKEIFPRIDLLINYSNTYDIEFYDNYSPEKTKLLLGAKYTPLRSEYKGISYTVNDAVRNILITTGGGDKNNTLGDLADFVRKKYQNIKIHIVAGVLNANIAVLSEKYKNDNMVEIHINVKNMSEIMCECDLALITAGTTASEICACGVPSICFAIVREQENDAKKFQDDGVMYFAGNIVENRDEAINIIDSRINQLINSIDDRKRFSGAMRDYVDGLGAQRIAEALICLAEEKPEEHNE